MQTRLSAAVIGVILCAPLFTGCRVATSAVTIRVMSYNVRHGQGDSTRTIEANLSVQARIIREQNPDLVALQEIDRNCERSGKVDQTAAFARLTGRHGTFARFMDFDGGEYGLAVLSRNPVAGGVVRLQLPPGRSEPRTALLCTYQPRPGISVVFACVHFDWYRGSAERLKQAERLIEYLGDIDWPIIIVGDYNAKPGSPTWKAFADAGFRYVKKSGTPFTFDARSPKVEIDHVFIRSSKDVDLSADPITVLDERTASDHRPIVTTIYATKARMR